MVTKINKNSIVEQLLLKHTMYPSGMNLVSISMKLNCTNLYIFVANVIIL